MEREWEAAAAPRFLSWVDNGAITDLGTQVQSAWEEVEFRLGLLGTRYCRTVLYDLESGGRLWREWGASDEELAMGERGPPKLWCWSSVSPFTLATPTCPPSFSELFAALLASGTPCFLEFPPTSVGVPF